MNNPASDITGVLRAIRKRPGFSALAIATLAVGIGATAGIFSMLEQWVLHPVHFRDPGTLVAVASIDKRSGGEMDFTTADYGDLESQNLFSSLTAWTSTYFNLAGGDRPERVLGARVTTNFLATLGVRPAIGRDFRPEEDQHGRSHVAIISNGLWKMRFGGDPNIAGRTIRVDGEPCTLIGVLPANFQLPLMGTANLWVPLGTAVIDRTNRNGTWLSLFARLKNGVSVSDAAAASRTLAARLAKKYPRTNAYRDIRLMTLDEYLGQHLGHDGMILLFGLVNCVLIMACANIGSLLLIRATQRRREIAVRLAVGAGRRHIIRQLLTENLVLFLIAAAAAVPFSLWFIEALVSQVSDTIRGYLPNYGVIEPNFTLIAFVIVVAVAAGLIFGLTPALQGTRVDLNVALREEGGRGSTGSAPGQKLRKALVAAEIALASIVLVLSSLMARSFANLYGIDLGFNTKDVVTAEVELPKAKYPNPAQVRSFYLQLRQSVAALPGVSLAAVTEAVPFGTSNNGSDEFTIEGRSFSESQLSQDTAVTPEFFPALGIRLLSGRLLTEQDTAGSLAVAVISRAFARRWFDKRNPLGERLRFRGADRAATIVGVVSDIKRNFNGGAADPQVWFSFAQFPGRDAYLLARTTSNRAAGLEQQLRDAVSAIDKDQPVSHMLSLRDLIDEQQSGNRLFIEMIFGFSAVALFLAALGVYGVMSYTIAGRTPEIGIRLALGAAPRRVLSLTLWQGVRLAAVGLILGTVAALGLAQLMGSLFYGITGHDPLAFGGALLILCAVALVACWIPARRASRIDPLVALRYE